MALPAIILGRAAIFALGYVVGHCFGGSKERFKGPEKLERVLRNYNVPIAERDAIIASFEAENPESIIDDMKRSFRPYAREISSLRDEILNEFGQMAGMSDDEKTQQALFTLGRKIMEDNNITPVDQGFDENEFDGFCVMAGKAAEEVIEEEGEKGETGE
ncbi:hypothetical protein ACFL3M_01760 [Patescibacteria group bacterium]